jgi:putative YphP/YqiW family bacilliredoxin
LYDLEAVKPYWEELKNIGVKPATTPEEVAAIFDDSEGTMLLVINSVCGCAAGHARPGIGLALQHNRIPDKLYTVFAGVDREATLRAREHIHEYEPSSRSRMDNWF